jgi:hypothetical protein
MVLQPVILPVQLYCEEASGQLRAPDSIRELANGGKEFRCVGSSRMRATVGRYEGVEAVFAGGPMVRCERNERMQHNGDGAIVCSGRGGELEGGRRMTTDMAAGGVTSVAQVCVPKIGSPAPSAVREDITGTLALDGGVGIMVP